MLRTLANRRPGVVMLLMALGPMGSGQTVQLVPDISIAEAEYRDANEAWLRNDPNLARDLFKADPEAVRRRIHRAAALSDDLMAKKQRYLQLVIERLQDTRKRLDQASEGAIPAAALRKDLEGQQARILGDQERVEGLLRDLPESDEYLFVKRALTEERSSLVALQNDIALRIRSLDSVGKAQEGIRAAPATSLTQKLDGVLKVWEEERAGAVRQRSRWAELYRAMEKSLEQKNPADKGGGAKPPKKAKAKDERPGPPANFSAVAKGRPSSSAPAGLAGTWVYRSEPGAWTGYGEPETVTLELRQEEGEWIGAYTARLPVRSGIHDVRLAVVGERRSDRVARLHWTSRDPAAEGAMEIHLSGDGRLLIERTASDDSYIPRGAEVLLTRP